MGTPPEGPARDRDRDTTIDAPDNHTGRRRRGPSMAHDRTMTPVEGMTSLSQVPTSQASPGSKQKELEPGAQVGEYRIEGLLGEGGMGRVYSAVHPVIGKKAAVKVLHPRMSANAEVVERFVQEARAVNQIGHPNIVDIFSFGTLPDGQSYFVMEWLKGESMHERVRRQPLTRDEVCHYVSDVSFALEAAHEKGIVHRDLKPENVFLQQVKDRLQIKLLDFGIAKLSGGEDNRIERTRTGAMMGTPKYIAPEQARGYAVDHRADIYSLGVMLFELVARRTPFIADNAMDLVASHLHDAPPRLSAVAPDVPPILDDVVDAMLAKDANARPSLARLRQVLDEVRALPPGDASYTIPDLLPPVTAAPTLNQPPQRRSRLPLIAAGGALVVGIGAFFVVRSLGESSEPVAPKEPPVAAQPPPKPADPPPPKPADPPPAKTVPATGTITIELARAVPGTLTVDGKQVPGTPPWKLDLAAGDHTITFRPRSGAPVSKSISIEAGKSVPLTLSPAAPVNNTPKPPKPPKPPTGGDDDFIAPTKKKAK